MIQALTLTRSNSVPCWCSLPLEKGKEKIKPVNRIRWEETKRSDQAASCLDEQMTAEDLLQIGDWRGKRGGNGGRQLDDEKKAGKRDFMIGGKGVEGGNGII